MASAETSRKKQNKNSKANSSINSLDKPLRDLSLGSRNPSKEGKSLVQRERSPVAGNRYSRYSGSSALAKTKMSTAEKSPNVSAGRGGSSQPQVGGKQLSS